MLFLLTSCANKNQPLDDITKFVENLSLCIDHDVCEDGMSKELIRSNRAQITTEAKRLELFALREGFSQAQIDAARDIGINNAKEIAQSKLSD